MSSKKQTTLGVIAAILFMVPAYLYLRDMIDTIMAGLNAHATTKELIKFTLHNSVAIVGYVLLSVSMLIKSNKVCTVGIIGGIIYPILEVIHMQSQVNFKTFVPEAICCIAYIMISVSWILLLLSVVKKKYRIDYHIMAAGVYLLDIVIRLLCGKYVSWWLDCGLGYYALYATGCIPVMLSYFVLSKLEFSPENMRGATNEKPEHVSDQENQYDNAMKLKELLDKGIITQEEFDQKKKELLNL